MSSKSKSSIPEPTVIIKSSSPATPRISKVTKTGVGKSDAGSPSPLSSSSRLSVDRSPKTVIPKPVIDRRSPKLATPPKITVTPLPEKQPTRILKGSELQAQLSVAQEDLKKTKEKLVLAEKEKDQAIEELKEAQRLAEDANEKLREASVAQKRAEEDSEIEKFRAVEIEQAGIESAQKKEDEWQRELETVRNQNALDVAALLSTTEELQRMKQELEMNCDAKNQALNHAEEATKIAEIHAEKVEILNAELVKLKALLDSKHDMEANEQSKLVSELNAEVHALKQELDKVKVYERELVEKDSRIEDLNVEHSRLVHELNVELATLKQELERVKVYEKESLEKESSIEQLNVELEAAKLVDTYARNVMEELKNQVVELEVQVDEANRLERSASESLESTAKQLEQSNASLHDAESEIASLQIKLTTFETLVGKLKLDLEDSDHRLVKTVEEASELEKKVESLKSELETVEEEKDQALSNEKLSAASILSLLEEKDKLVAQLEDSREEEEKSKKAMESLASALHEVSSETREVKEQLLSCQAENEKYGAEMEDLKLAFKATGEDYERMLRDAKHKIDDLTNSAEQSRHENEKYETQMEDLKLSLKATIEDYERMLRDANHKIDDLTNSVEQSKHESEKYKTQMEDLKLALKATGEDFERMLRDAKREIDDLTNSVEQFKKEKEKCEIETEDLKLVLKEANDKYETMLGKAKHEIDDLASSVEQSKLEYQSSKAEWGKKELHLTSSLKQSEEETASMEKEMSTLVSLLKQAEEKAYAAEVEGSQLKDSLKKAESEVMSLKEVIVESKAKAKKLKEHFLDKENELQSAIQENENLRTREAATVKKIEELSKALEEAMTEKEADENGDLSDSEKDYDMLPKVVEFSEQNGGGSEDKLRFERPVAQSELIIKETPLIQIQNNVASDMKVLSGIASVGDDSNGKMKDNGNSKGKEEEDVVEVDYKMWESCKIGESPERDTEHESSFDDETDSKGDNCDHANGGSLSAENVENGGTSPSKEQQLQKKKKPLLKKFGSLLRKKNSINQK